MSQPIVHLVGKAKNVKELKFSAGGTAFLSFGCVQAIKKGDDTRFDWYNVTLFGATAEALAGKIQDGTRFAVTGRQSLGDIYEKQDGTLGVGINVSVIDFQFTGEKPTEDGAPTRATVKRAVAKAPVKASEEEGYDPGF